MSAGWRCIRRRAAERWADFLLAQVEMFARRHGDRRLTLSTTPFLTGAIQLYERAGFRRVEEGPDDLRGTPLFMDDGEGALAPASDSVR
jgi:ribosomal protein S18 acetylase RimI-like enzyme